MLVESPEALNIIKEGHIKSIISLLDKHGRNHKVSEPFAAMNEFWNNFKSIFKIRECLKVCHIFHERFSSLNYNRVI